jgi:hypothetical protein
LGGFLSRFTFCLLLSLAALALAEPAVAESFKSAGFLPVASGVDYVLAADLNGDGKLDLIYLPLAGPSPRSLHVLLGTGDGTFAAAQSVPMPSTTFGNFGRFAIADVNKDGKLDLIVVASNALSSNIAVLLGNGDGTFQAGIVSAGPTSNATFPVLDPHMGTADFNGDGAVDIVIADVANDTLSILLGDNQGHFTLKNTWQDGNNPTDIHVADLNGDGHMDFVARGGLAANAIVYLGKGDGTFQPPVTYTGSHNIQSVVLYDMNHDGHLDMVVSGFGDTVDILLGNADGTFSNASAGGSTYAGVGPTVVAVEDFDGDGILDIAVGSHNGIGILRGQPGLTYANVSQFPVTPFPYTVTSGDFNADGHIDFAVACADGIALLFGNPDGTFYSADAYDLLDNVSSVVSGDFNGDNIPDIAVGLVDAPPRILLGKGDGTFTITPDQGQPNNTFMGLTGVGDFNGDHKLDLLSGVGNGFVEFGNGDGTFSAPTSLPNAGRSLAGAVTADFNNDGIADLAFFTPTGITFLTAKPDLSYSQFIANLPAFPTPIGGGLAFADLNHDGKLDAIVYISFFDTAFKGSVAILLGNGDGTFTTGSVYPAAFTPAQNFALADVDGDGNIDIILPAGSSSANPIMATGAEIQLFYGNGDGTFQSPVSFQTPHSIAYIAAADLNLDGIADLVLSDGNVVTVMHGAANRTFGPPRDYPAGDFPATPVIADLNGDGAPDLIFANSEVNGVTTATVLLNLGVTRGSLTPTPSPAVYGQPITLTATYAGTVVGSGFPTGPVNFSIDNAAASSAPLQDGVASITDNQLLVPGTHAVTATWAGDSTFNPHNLAGQVRVTTANSSTALSISPSVVVVGQSALLTARVAPPFNGVPTGTVRFGTPSTPPNSANLNSSATATFAVDTSKLALGSYSYTAAYSGDKNFNPSISAAAQLKVTDFSITVNPGSLALAAGGAGSVAVSVNSSSGFNGSVDLSCGGVPANAHCSFAPSSISLGNSASASSTLSLNATGVASIPLARWGRNKTPLWCLFPLLAVFFVVALFGLRTRMFRSLLPIPVGVSVLLAVVSILAGCGGGGSGGSGGPPPATSYTIQVQGTVHGSNPATSRTATFVLTIQQ